MKNMTNMTKLTIMSLVVAVGLQACSGEQGGMSGAKSMLQAVMKKNKESVTIKRDAFGMAHIFADDNYGLFFGYGYAVAQDRLYQLEIMKRATQGKIAEVLGADYIEFDKTQRSLFWPAEIRAQLDMLDAKQRAIFTGFAAGINRHIEEVKAAPTQSLPFEFTHNQFMPENWSAYDVAQLFVGSMFLRYGDFNTELENQDFLDGLRAQHGQEIAQLIFDAVNPRHHDKAPTTIPAADWQWNKQISKARPVRNHAPIHAPNPAFDKQVAHAPLTQIVAPPTQGFSNALVLGPKRLHGANTVLINGPQFGWYVPSYTYSIGFHTDDWHAVGNAPVGYLLPMFGHNEYISWGSTWGASDNVDIFRETRHPQNATQYRHNGQWKTFDMRVETIKVKDGADVEFTAYRTVHGPVVEMNEKYAYAKQRGWAGRELDTLMGWIEATKAKNHAEWRAAVSRSAINVNWYYGDREGNIAYMSTGAYPKRAPAHDNRLPVSGEGFMDWRGFHPPTANPHVLNPSSGYIANWNNKPGKGFLNPDEWWYSWSQADRIKILNDLLSRAGELSPQKVWDLFMQASYIDPNAAYFLPPMQAALANSDNPRHRRVAQILQNWDRRFMDFEKANDKANMGRTRNAQTYYSDPANAIFRTWLGEMLAQTFVDDLGGANGENREGGNRVGKIIATTTAYGTPEQPTIAGLNISVGLKLLYEVLLGRPDYDFFNGVSADTYWLTSLDASLAKLEKQFGTTDMTKWLLAVPPTRFHHTNFFGIPQTTPQNARDDAPDMNRGTENNMTVFMPDKKIMTYEIVPPGQSGFIAPDGTKAKHYADQFELYLRHEKKPVWFRKADIDRNTKSQQTLRFTRP